MKNFHFKEKNLVIGLIISSIILITTGAGCNQNKNTNNKGQQNINVQPVEVTTVPVNNKNIQVVTEPASSATVKTYSLAEVNNHNSVGDCWTVVSGKVYNITTYIPMHKGGPSIIQACGIDSTQVFDAKHNPQALNKVSQFYLGQLQ